MKKLLLTYLIGLFLFSCTDPYEDSTFLAYDKYPVATYLSTREDDFSLWIELLRYTKLYSTFNLNTQYTAFVPNNTAMSKYLSNNGYKSITDIDLEYATYLVKYHTLHEKVLKQEGFTSGVMDWATITDDHLSITFKEGGINAIYINNTSLISELNIEVTNGVIHVIEEVLIPVVETIWDRLNTNEFDIMKEAIELTGYNNLLDTVSAETMNDYGQIVIKRFYYTLFAITDSIYSKDGINSINDLLAKLGENETDYTSTSNLLNMYVAYHIANQSLSYNSLSDFEDNVLSKNINTLSPKELINLSVSETNELLINYNSEDSTGTSFIFEKNDISCRNGVIHHVDTWMPIKTPPTTVVDWDLANYSDLASYVNYFQSPNPNGGKVYSESIPDGEVKEYYWEPVPLTKTNVITYVNSDNNDGVRYLYSLFYDHIAVSTGAGGWVEIQSPVIVKGTYKMTLYYIRYQNSNNSGEMQCYMDGNKLGSSFITSSSLTEQYTSKILTSSISFSETDTHTLRIVGIDGGNLLLDYIKLEPIN
ncbi:MAG: fasciclin domain-containing protein [Marinilabiliaceae bacterium]|nr:fasciclin domain-containing protein [Marinilabiliaceae bacterium]